MRVEYYKDLTDPKVASAKRVVIYDKFDNPVAIAVEIDEHTTMAATAEHPEFNAMLAALGLDKTVVVQTVDQKDIRQIKF